MEFIDKDLILEEIPLFAKFTPEEKSLIKEKSSLREYKKGQIIYEEGASADAFYCIILGRVTILTRDKDGSETVLEYLHRGKYFGIISLLTGEPHSVTARVLNDSFLLTIQKEDFNCILNKIPKLAIDLSQTLSRRLKRKDIHQKTIFETSIISLFSSYSQASKVTYAVNLALSLNLETHKSVVILEIAPQDNAYSLPTKLEIEGGSKNFSLSGSQAPPTRNIKEFILKNRFNIDLICLSYQQSQEGSIKKLVDILNLLVNDYHYIVLVLPSTLDASVLGMLNQSDLIHILTIPEPVDLERTHNLIERLKSDFNFNDSKIQVILNEYKFSKLTHDQATGLLPHEIFATLPKIELAASDRPVLDQPESEYARAIRRISRQIGERMVGLALGVGVAYGFCHIGVLKVIEEEKIPVDVIVGSSIGAIIASLWATGKSSAEILEITQEFRESKYIWNLLDFTFPVIGFIKGNKLYRFLKKHLNNKTFRDIRLPLKIIASDVKKKESIVLDRGLLIDALMVSCAMPGVFRPFKRGEMLFDGGVVHPLPTEPLFKMGVKKIIAVNVTPSREDILKQFDRIKKDASALNQVPNRKGRFSLGQFLRSKLRLNILDIIFSSIELMQSEIAKREGQLADVILHPDTQGLFWLELHKSAEFARRGEEETRRSLEKIWQVINE